MNEPRPALRLSVVVPMHNEEENAPRMHGEIDSVLRAWGKPYEILFVDDGSKDRTWEVLSEIHRKDPAHVRALRLKRNFGQTPAMVCGIDHARGEVVVTMDGDLQNDPADIPALVGKLDEGYDVVCGWRYKRQDKLWSRKVPSMVANRMIANLTGVRLHDYGCSLKAYRGDAIKRTPLYAEFHRFIPAMATLTGATIAEMKVNHRARVFGKTKYNLSRTWRVALDMLTVSLLIKFSNKPLRLFGLLALFSTLVALICIERSWNWYTGPYWGIPQVLPSIAVLALWLAGHFWTVGLTAELCLATAHHRTGDFVSARQPNVTE